MSRQSKAMRLRFVVTMGMVLAAGAVSMGTSCVTAPKSKPSASTGTINGVVDTSNGGPIGAGLNVTATDDATGTRISVNTAADGSFSLTQVPVGTGKLTVGPFGTGSGCSTPAATNYSMTKAGTLQEIISVTCLDGPGDVSPVCHRPASRTRMPAGSCIRHQATRNEPRQAENPLFTGKSLAALRDENVMCRGQCARTIAAHWR
jgi:hypothetical protein